MALTIKEANALIGSGKAEEIVKRFIGQVKFSVVTGRSAALSLDDALVVSLVLSQLLDSPDGRKLMKKPKRKNLQYRAEDFSPSSPERDIAWQVITGKCFFEDALNQLEGCFDASGKPTPDRERTLKRLLEDLILQEKCMAEGVANILASCGWDGETKASLESVSRAVLTRLGGPFP